MVYGQDDRKEVFEEPNEAVRDLAENSTAALVLRTQVAVDRSGAVALDAPTAMEAFDLCADDRFAAQPSAALCTAVLVAPDVALTAGHCLAWMSCSRLALVFGDHHARVIGIATGGESDFAIEPPETCARTRHLDPTRPEQGEKVGHIHPMLLQLCAAPHAPPSFCHSAPGPSRTLDCRTVAVGTARASTPAVGWFSVLVAFGARCFVRFYGDQTKVAASSASSCVRRHRLDARAGTRQAIEVLQSCAGKSGGPLNTVTVTAWRGCG